MKKKKPLPPKPALIYVMMLQKLGGASVIYNDTAFGFRQKPN